MREILFRGKTHKGKWVYGAYCHLDWIDDDESKGIGKKPTIIDYNNECLWTYILPETVGQYTGLTDKNGTKIFEGDIVAYDGTYPLEVYIEKGHTKMRWYDTISTLKCNEMFFGTDTFYGECKVIGNIHDNPELLEV